MIFENTLKESGELYEINWEGTSFHVLKAAPVTRAVIYHQGSKLIDTVVWQGMSLNNIRFDKIVISSDSPQDIAIWAGRVPFDFKEVSSRQQTIMGTQSFIGNGVHELLTNDPSRIIARIECDSDIWIGGPDLEVIQGVVQNGRKYKAGQEFELTAYGDVKCWITDNAEVELFKNDGTIQNIAIPWQYGRVLARTELENLNVPYFDVVVPPRMDGVPFAIHVQVEHLANTGSGVKLFYTKGDPSTEALGNLGWVSGGPYDAGEINEWQGVEAALPNGLSAGAHRFFMVDESSTNGKAEGELADTRFNRIWTDNGIYAIGGICQIMQERA